jgi:peptidyl-tRNA hydrolase
VICRKDLSIGIQAVQSGHAAIQFQYEHPELAKNWYTNSNYLIFLSTEDENSLKELIQKANSQNIKISIFREPDINNEITAIALEPCDKSRKMTSGLPLMRKEISYG